MSRHFGRSFFGHALEDACPCPKAPCGLVGGDTEIVFCGEHSVAAMKTIRQSHDEFECPAYLPHEVHWTLRAQEGVAPKFTCSAPEGAPCRLTCPEGCEAWTLEGHDHELIDGGECMLLPWLDNIGTADAIEAYVGEPAPPTDGPVKLEYVEEWVEWSYVTEPLVAAVEPEQ